jgi:hypothetical protein
VSQTKGLKHISFLAHPLGGLFSRYTIADLYRLNDKSQGEVDISNGSHFPGYSNARSIHWLAWSQSILSQLLPPILDYRVVDSVRNAGSNIYIRVNRTTTVSY